MKKYHLQRFDDPNTVTSERKALILETARDVINQSPSIKEINSSDFFKFNFEGYTFLKLPAISFILNSLSVHNTYIVSDNRAGCFFLEMAIKCILDSGQNRYDLFYKDCNNHDRLISYTIQPDGKKYFVITDSLGFAAQEYSSVNSTILKVIKDQDITLLPPHTHLQQDRTNCGIFTLDALTRIQTSPELLQAIIASKNKELPLEMRSLEQVSTRNGGVFNGKAGEQKLAYLKQLPDMFSKVPNKLELLSILDKYDLPFLFQEIIGTFVAIFSNKQDDYIEESVTDIIKLISEYIGDTSMLMLNDFFIKAIIPLTAEELKEQIEMVANFTLDESEDESSQVADDSVESLGDSSVYE